MTHVEDHAGDDILDEVETIMGALTVVGILALFATNWIVALCALVLGISGVIFITNRSLVVLSKIIAVLAAVWGLAALPGDDFGFLGLIFAGVLVVASLAYVARD